MRLPACVLLVLFVAVGGMWGCRSDVATPTPPQAAFNSESPADEQIDFQAPRALELQKVQVQARRRPPGDSPFLGSGGPDLFGYTWIDSDDPSGPTYDWVDISGVGTPVPFLNYHDDGTVGPVPIGFSFPFYGSTFTEVYPCTNGWLSFTNGTLETFTNQPLPNGGSTVPENLLAFWWDDMVYDESDGNSVYYYNDGSRFILQYFVRRLADFSPPFYRFQVILYPNGDIVYQYDGLDDNVSSCTIGIQNGTKDDGLTVVHNDGSYPHEGLAILFTATQALMIDIKPRSAENPINPNGRGVIPVAILTTDTFDATQVDASTIAFGPAAAAYAHKYPHLTDVDDDGDIDLLVHFRTQETGISPGDTEACLSAELLDGHPASGCDAITTTPPETP